MDRESVAAVPKRRSTCLKAVTFSSHIFYRQHGGKLEDKKTALLNASIAILESAIQVAPPSAERDDPAWKLLEHRALTSLSPVTADTGPEKEEGCLASYPKNLTFNI
jgi:hypothetical protein